MDSWPAVLYNYCTTPLLYTTPAVVGMILNKNKTFHKAKAFKLLVDSGSSIYQELCRMLLYATLGFHFLVGYLRISCITRKLVFSRFGKTVARIGVLLMLRGGTLFVHIGLKKKTWSTACNVLLCLLLSVFKRFKKKNGSCMWVWAVVASFVFILIRRHWKLH